MKKVISKSDILFTVLFAGAALVLFLLLMLIPAGAQAVVTQNGAVVYTLPLDRETTVTVTGAYTNEITVKNGAVWVSFTDCPNHICEHQGHITRGSIVCAPNGVVITVTNGEGDVDAVAQ